MKGIIMNKDILKDVAIAVSGVIGAAAGAAGTAYVLNRKNNKSIEGSEVIDVDPIETEE
jgi:hypothetical protein